MRDALFDNLWSDSVEHFYSPAEYSETYLECSAIVTPTQDTEIFKLFDLEEPSETLSEMSVCSPSMDMDVPFFIEEDPFFSFESDMAEPSPQGPPPCSKEAFSSKDQSAVKLERKTKTTNAVHFFKPFQQQAEEEESLPERKNKSDSEAEDSEDISPSSANSRRSQLTKITSRQSKVILRSPDPKVLKKKRATKSQSRKAVAPQPLEESADADSQCTCCITGCGNVVTNRLRFSLRRPNTFKEEHLEKNWNKVCGYHYFHDLYQHKKMSV
jgi:hypothetical protein